MPWVETRAQGFVARHDSRHAEGARRILDTLAFARGRVEGLLAPEPADVAVVVHPSELSLSLGQPVLPVFRALTAPAYRRYLAGWLSADEIHVLAPHLLEGRASAVRGSRELMLLVPAILYARMAIGAAHPRLPPPFTPGASVRYARWAWLVEGAAHWLAGAVPHLRPAVSRRLREGRPPAFPPRLRDASLLGGTLLDLVAREEGAGAVAQLVLHLHPRGPRAALASAFGRRSTAATERAWRAELERIARERPGGPYAELTDRAPRR